MAEAYLGSTRFKLPFGTPRRTGENYQYPAPFGMPGRFTLPQYALQDTEVAVPRAGLKLGDSPAFSVGDLPASLPGMGVQSRLAQVAASGGAGGTRLPVEAPTQTLSYEDAAAAVSGGSGAEAPTAPFRFRGSTEFDPSATPYWGGVGGMLVEPSEEYLKAGPGGSYSEAPALLTASQMAQDAEARGVIEARNAQAIAAIEAAGERNDPTLKQIAARKKDSEYEQLLPQGSRSTMRFTDPKRGIRDLTPDVEGDNRRFGPSVGQAIGIVGAVEKAKAGRQRNWAAEAEAQADEEHRQFVMAELEEMENSIKRGADREAAKRRFALRVQAHAGQSLAEALRMPKDDLGLPAEIVTPPR